MLYDRCRRFRAVALAMGGLMAVGSLIPGCASEARKLPISYVPQQNVQAIKGAGAVPVEVRVEDLQPDEYWSTWDALNPFADEATVRFHVEDAADIVKGAAETELKARGFKIAADGALVTIQLDRFAAQMTESGGAWKGVTATVRGYISMRVQVRPQTGKVLFSRKVGAEAEPISRTLSKLGRHPVAQMLQASLAETFKGLFGDPAFMAAILAARQPPPAKPAVRPGLIAGVFATMSRR